MTHILPHPLRGQTVPLIRHGDLTEFTRLCNTLCMNEKTVTRHQHEDHMGSFCYWRVTNDTRAWTVRRTDAGWLIVNDRNNGVSADGFTGRQLIAAVQEYETTTRNHG